MVDIFIIVVLVWALFSGWRAGLLKEVTSGIGVLVGLLVAATCYSTFGKYLAVNGTETNMVTSIIAFLLLWIIVPIALGFVANVLTKSLKGMNLGMPNSMLGALVSLIKYVVVLSCVFNVMQGLGILNAEKAKDSKLLNPVTMALGMFFDNDKDCEYAPDANTDSVNAAKPDSVWVNLDHKADSAKTKSQTK